MLTSITMTLPERDTPEWSAMGDRVNRRIMDLASNVAVRRKNLPPQIQVMIHDEITGERWASFVYVQYVGNNGIAKITRTSVGCLADDVRPVDIADILLKDFPDTPLVCDEKIANELSQHSLSWVEEDHYRLEGRPDGVLEVYTPYKAINLEGDLLPRGIAGAQIFTE